MKPILNLDDVSERDFLEREMGPFHAKHANLSKKIGARELSYSLNILPPGKKMCPFHNHHINEEMFLILEGEGTLRYGDKEYPLKKHDIIACPPGGREVAHQIVNTSTRELKYLGLSTEKSHEICEYPDSNKLMSVIGNFGDVRFRHIGKLDQGVDYMEGETR